MIETIKYDYDRQATKLQRNREVRDLYRKLMRHYRSHKVAAFFNREYFISPDRLNHIVTICDEVPLDVKKSSTIYRIAIKDNYTL